MPDEKYSFEQARIRLEEIASEVRKKDTSLERSLDLLEEGVRLANTCTELVDHVDFDVEAVARASEAEAGPEAPVGSETTEPGAADDAADMVDEPEGADEPEAEGRADAVGE